jgi:hypothetical protein
MIFFNKSLAILMVGIKLKVLFNVEHYLHSYANYIAIIC